MYDIYDNEIKFFAGDKYICITQDLTINTQHLDDNKQLSNYKRRRRVFLNQYDIHNIILEIRIYKNQTIKAFLDFSLYRAVTIRLSFNCFITEDQQLCVKGIRVNKKYLDQIQQLEYWAQNNIANANEQMQELANIIYSMYNTYNSTTLVNGDMIILRSLNKKLKNRRPCKAGIHYDGMVYFHNIVCFTANDLLEFDYYIIPRTLVQTYFKVYNKFLLDGILNYSMIHIGNKVINSMNMHSTQHNVIGHAYLVDDKYHNKMYIYLGKGYITNAETLEIQSGYVYISTYISKFTEELLAYNRPFITLDMLKTFINIDDNGIIKTQYVKNKSSNIHVLKNKRIYNCYDLGEIIAPEINGIQIIDEINNVPYIFTPNKPPKSQRKKE